MRIETESITSEKFDSLLETQYLNTNNFVRIYRYKYKHAVCDNSVAELQFYRVQETMSLFQQYKEVI